MLAATRCWPGCGRARCTASAYGSAEPRTASSDSAATGTAARSRAARSWQASAASPRVAALLLMNPSASLARMRELRRRAGAALPRALAEQAQPGGGQRGEVAGADRPVERHRRGEAAVDGVGQDGQQRRIDARAASTELVEPHDEHGAGHLGRQQRPGARGVAAQQPYPVLGSVPLAEFDHVVGAHSGVPAVHRLPRGQFLHGQPRRPRRGHGRAADGDARLLARHRHQRGAAQRPPVDDHNCAGHGSRPLSVRGPCCLRATLPPRTVDRALSPRARCCRAPREDPA